MDLLLEAKVLLLLAFANGTPVIVQALFGSRGALALDAGCCLGDGEPLFGQSKTVRGILSSLVFTILAATVLSVGWSLGLLLAATAMAGDLASSFIKRRMGLPSSSRATGLDQLPESLLPLLVCMGPLGLSVLDIVSVAIAFFLGEVVLSRILFGLHLRNRPY